MNITRALGSAFFELCLPSNNFFYEKVFEELRYAFEVVKKSLICSAGDKKSLLYSIFVYVVLLCTLFSPIQDQQKKPHTHTTNQSTYQTVDRCQVCLMERGEGGRARTQTYAGLPTVLLFPFLLATKSTGHGVQRVVVVLFKT